ncbi:hypothetical protein DPMN_191208 [Dreissena polymorpha]|uniref:Uncharacterized protein n=1 Tax=Dreissena polymorpha TaxID=45954 RepID=A0A9D4BD86_DREPO|nr:hypothetical protein DPMN_191208 [Dreissena polymorpha]
MLHPRFAQLGLTVIVVAKRVQSVPLLLPAWATSAHAARATLPPPPNFAANQGT